MSDSFKRFIFVLAIRWDQYREKDRRFKVLYVLRKFAINWVHMSPFSIFRINKFDASEMSNHLIFFYFVHSFVCVVCRLNWECIWHNTKQKKAATTRLHHIERTRVWDCRIEHRNHITEQNENSSIEWTEEMSVSFEYLMKVILYIISSFSRFTFLYGDYVFCV